MVAWLVTLVPGPDEKVVTILKPLLSSRRVREIIERLYVDLRLGLRGRLEYAKTGRVPYPARVAVVDGVPYAEELYCGDGHRFLWARKVDKLRVVTRPDGQEQLAWEERPRPDLRALGEVLSWSEDQRTDGPKRA